MASPPRISDVIRRLCPDGTGKRNDWSMCPVWPPDAFGVAANLATISGCYSNDPYTCSLKRETFSSPKNRGKRLKAGDSRCRVVFRLLALWNLAIKGCKDMGAVELARHVCTLGFGTLAPIHAPVCSDSVRFGALHALLGVVAMRYDDVS